MLPIGIQMNDVSRAARKAFCQAMLERLGQTLVARMANHHVCACVARLIARAIRRAIIHHQHAHNHDPNHTSWDAPNHLADGRALIQCAQLHKQDGVGCIHSDEVGRVARAAAMMSNGAACMR